jgi:hypothetical protein
VVVIFGVVLTPEYAGLGNTKSKSSVLCRSVVKTGLGNPISALTGPGLGFVMNVLSVVTDASVSAQFK